MKTSGGLTRGRGITDKVWQCRSEDMSIAKHSTGEQKKEVEMKIPFAKSFCFYQLAHNLYHVDVLCPQTC